MPDRESPIPKTQTSAPVSRERVKDAVTPDPTPRQANPDDESSRRREEDAAGGDRAIAEYD